MIRKIKYIPTLLVLLLLYGCPDHQGMNIDVFYVENQSDNPFKIATYSTIDESLIGGFGLPKQNGESISFSSDILKLNEDFVSLERCDSAIIVLGDRYLIHKYDQENKVFLPDEKNIFRISSYTQETPSIYRMELNQEDYDNATPCNNDPICGE